MAIDLKTIPLTQDDKEHLLHMFAARRKLLFMAYVILVPLALILSFRVDYRIWSGKTHHWNKHDNGGGLIERQQMIAINMAWLLSILAVVGVPAYMKRVRVCKKDVQKGIKECVPCTVTMKLHFENTGQYFLSLNDPAYLHHEVDEETYYNYSEGDIVYLFRAPLSRHVFNNKGKFTLL